MTRIADLPSLLQNAPVIESSAVDDIYALFFEKHWDVSVACVAVFIVTYAVAHVAAPALWNLLEKALSSRSHRTIHVQSPPPSPELSKTSSQNSSNSSSKRND